VILKLAYTDDNLPRVPNYVRNEDSLDATLGTNIGVHPTNNNLFSICHQVLVKIFDIRNTNKPVNTINIDQLHSPGKFGTYCTTGVSGAHWSPNSGKYFLACSVMQRVSNFGYLTSSTVHKPCVFNGEDITSTPVLNWPAISKSPSGSGQGNLKRKLSYQSASFSHYFGSSWCPWEDAVFLTTAKYSVTSCITPNNSVVAVDAVTGEVVAEISEGLSYPAYLICCYRNRNWMAVANCKGPGDLAIYKAED